jgi:DNA-binding transcriptional regulator YbjK
MKLELSQEKLQEFNAILQSLPISELAKVEKITQLINNCVVQEAENPKEEKKK